MAYRVIQSKLAAIPHTPAKSHESQPFYHKEGGAKKLRRQRTDSTISNSLFSQPPTKRNKNVHPNNLLPISVAHVGQYKDPDTMPTQPRNPNGSIASAFPMSMGDSQAHYDITNTPIAPGLQNTGQGGGHYNLVRRIPRFY